MFARLKWILFGAAGVALAAFALVEDEATKSTLAGVFGVALGFCLLAMARAGVAEGEIRGRSRRVRREENPTAFRGIVALYTVVGLALAAGALYSLLSG
ncbi:MAG: hypothetical protein R3199_06500 [Gemmatimonadota bacterium]|nr:hypothetical protein [Gemmatimonadota bacterium]